MPWTDAPADTPHDRNRPQSTGGAGGAQRVQGLRRGRLHPADQATSLARQRVRRRQTGNETASPGEIVMKPTCFVLTAILLTLATLAPAQEAQPKPDEI